MGNKQQLQLNNETLGSILSNVLGLPSQESLKHGAYVWKKFEEYSFEGTANVIANQITDAINPTILQLSSENVDLSKVDIAFFNGAVFHYSYGSTSYTFTISGTNIVRNDGTSYSISYDKTSAQLSISTSFVAGVSWTIDGFQASASTKTFLDFVVSDSESAYPDGGTQDGYWYEKFQLEPTLFGYTKISVDKFTFANDIGSQEFVTHNLGDVPKMAIIIGKSVFGGLRYMFTRPEIEQQSQLNGYIFTLYGSNYSLATSSIKFNVDANRLRSVDYAYGYQGGMEYTLITMA